MCVAENTFTRSERRIVRCQRTTEAQNAAKVFEKVARPLFRQSQGECGCTLPCLSTYVSHSHIVNFTTLHAGVIYVINMYIAYRIPPKETHIGKHQSDTRPGAEPGADAHRQRRELLDEGNTIPFIARYRKGSCTARWTTPPCATLAERLNTCALSPRGSRP